MTLREKLADLLTGGALTRAQAGWDRAWALYKLRDESALNGWEAADNYRNALTAIAAQEKPTSNATVRRMARIAREALK